MPVVQAREGRSASGSAVVAFGDSWTATGSEVAAVAETSLFSPPSGAGGQTPGPIDVSRFHEAVLLVNVAAIGGTSPSFIITVYACDALGTRYTALVTRTVTVTGKSRDLIPVPASNPGYPGSIGNFIEVTKQLTGTSPTVTATVELQVKT